MHHYQPSAMVIWLFILLAVFLVGTMLYFAPKIMKYLDDFADRRKERTDIKSNEEKQTKKNRSDKTR